MKYIFLFFILFTSKFLLANEITVEQAREIAVDFFSAKMRTRNGTPQLQLVWDGENIVTRSVTTPAFYVFNRMDSDGFVIVSGDDVSMPILGYSFSNHFVAENMPPNLLDWMNGLRNQINAARKEHVMGTSYVSKFWTRASDAVGSPIVELSTALWDQQAPFNRLSPTTSAGKAITGCVSTAMAIIMQYYQWPDQGVGTTPAYVLQADKNTQIPSKTFERPYVWSKMPVRVDKNSDTDIKDEVATLIYDCGIISKSQFGKKSTWAYYKDALEGMITYMKYNKGAHMQNRATRVMSEWHQMLRKELDARRPILYTGSTKSGGGHMFVVDGYTQENYYHINWGWSGSSNGYYLLTVMNPSNPGSGSSSGGYTQEQAAFFNLIPDKNGTSAFTDNLVLVRKEVNGVYYEGLVIDANDIQTNQEFKISIGAINNIGRSVFDGNLRIALADKDGTIKEYISEKIPVRFPADSHQNCITDCSCKITLPIKAGDRIRVYYKGKYSEDWDYLRGGSLLRSEIILKEEDIPLEKMTSFAYDKENKRISLRTYPRVDYQLLSLTNKVVFSGITDDDNPEIRIDTSELTDREYVIILRKKIEDEDEYEEKRIRFVIGN